MSNNNNQQRKIFHSNKRLADYLFDLPYPYNIEAYLNYREQVRTELNNLDPITGSPIMTLSKALIMAFLWDKTKEGDKYWRDLHTWLLQKEENGN